jgi:RNA polymerase sigma-70 factor (ECF subfamily)
MRLQMSGTATASKAEAAWRELHDQLLGYIARRVRTREDAEDILQEVMLRIHRHSGDLEQADRIAGWIYRITANAIVDYYRKPARRELPAGWPADTPEPRDGAAHSLSGESSAAQLRSELARCLIPLIERLPPSYRQALVLTELEGVTQVEAAARAGISVSGMKARVQRGRRQLKDLLLDCCHVELDRHGAVASYRSRHGSCEKCGPRPEGDLHSQGPPAPAA